MKNPKARKAHHRPSDTTLKDLLKSLIGNIYHILRDTQQKSAVALLWHGRPSARTMYHPTSSHCSHINESGTTSLTRAVAPHLRSSAKARTFCSSSFNALRLAALLK